MKKKKSFIFIIIFSLFIFFIFFQSLYKENFYTPEGPLNDLIKFESNELYSNKNYKSDQIFLNEDITLINIWSSWCLPCRKEHEYLMALSKSNKINMVGLNYKDKKENAKNFIVEFGNPYNLILTDPQGIISIELGAYGVPETFIIKNKKVIKKIVGPINKTSVKEIIKMIR